MYPEPLLFGKYVTFYGVMIAIGIVVCVILLRFLGKKNNVDHSFMEVCETIIYAAILVGFFFASLFQSFYDYLKTNVWEWFTGLTFLGGLIGGVLAFTVIYNIVARKKKINGKVIDLLIIAPPCITIAHSFGRIGCFFAGCCGGKEALETDFFYFLSVQFPDELHRTYPTQLFESFFLLVLTIVMLVLILKWKFKYSFVVYTFSYGIWRFFIEFVRGDNRGAIFPDVSFLSWMTPSQFWSILMVIGSVPLFFWLRYLLKTRGNVELVIEETQNSDLK